MDEGHQAVKDQNQAVAAQAASRRLAEFAVGLTYDRIPPEVVERTKDCVIDTVAACVYGSQLPWSGGKGARLD